MEVFSKGWHVLYVKSRHEKKIDCMLKENKLESFLPTITTLSQWSDRKKKIQKPLFPSYVFIYLNSRKDFYDALNVQGVFKYLRFGENYARVRNKEILWIKQFLKLEGISDVEVSNRILTAGQKMTINCGSLSGVHCEVVKVNKKSKVFVRIDSLRQNITAIVPANYLSSRRTGK